MRRVVTVLAAALLIVLLSPSVASACDVTYQGGGAAGGCGGSAPLIGTLAFYSSLTAAGLVGLVFTLFNGQEH